MARKRRETAKAETALKPADEQARQLQLQSALDAVAVEHARKDLAFFIEYVLRDDEGQPIVLEETHKEGLRFIQWCHEQGKFPVIEGPWGSGKTTIYVVGIALFAIGCDPNVRIGVFSNLEDLAADRVGAIKSYIEESPEFQKVFPKIERNPEIWSKHKFQVKRTSKDPTATCQARGITGAKVGARYDLILPDDITDYDNSVTSRKKREDVDHRLHNAVMSRLSDDGNLLYVATAWHSQDATEKLKKDDRFAVMIQAVSDDCSSIEQVNLVTKVKISLPLPRILSREKLLAEKRNKPRVFARGRQQKPYTEEEKTFGEDMVDLALRYGEAAKMLMVDLPRGVGIDLSSAKRAGNAFVGGVWDERAMTLYVDECQLEAWTSPQVGAWIQEYHINRAPEWFVVENNAYQTSLKEWTEATSDAVLPIEAFTTTSNKADLNLGLPGLSSALKAGGILIVFDKEHETDCGCGLCKLVKDLKEHPFGDTDSIMGLWFLWRRFRTTGIGAGGFGKKDSTHDKGKVYSARQNIHRHRGARRRLV